MDEGHALGTMPVFRGALRAKLLLGMDSRLLLAAVLCGLCVIFSPWMILMTGAIVAFGRIAGKISPYLLDDLTVYLEWRAFSWDAVVPDDVFIGHDEPKFVKQFRRTRI